MTYVARAAFDDADSLYILDIYAASEPPINGVTADALTKRLQNNGRRAQYLSNFNEAAAIVADDARPGDLVLTLGAGNVSQLGPMVLEALSQRTPT